MRIHSSDIENTPILITVEQLKNKSGTVNKSFCLAMQGWCGNLPINSAANYHENQIFQMDH